MPNTPQWKEKEREAFEKFCEEVGLDNEKNSGFYMQGLWSFFENRMEMREKEVYEKMEEMKERETGQCDCDDCGIRCDELPEKINEVIEKAQSLLLLARGE